ncbi:MAG: nuclear transport factor 2 family protein [Microthrixaceae bacterium]
MGDATDQDHGDGRIPSPERVADRLAIQDLAVAYGFAVDDADWPRWRALFTDDAELDYTHSGGIAGGIEEVTAWMPQGLSVFTWSLHSVLTHEIRFTGPDTATGRVHLFNRNGVEWEGRMEFCDVGGLYLDEYRRVGDSWRFSRRTERSHYIAGGEFAALVRGLAATTAPDLRPPMG